jgi:hypothetical protein
MSMLFPKRPKMPHELTEEEKDSLILDIALTVLRMARNYGSQDAPQMARELFSIKISEGNRREELIGFVNRHKKDWLVNSHHRADFVCVFGQTL